MRIAIIIEHFDASRGGAERLAVWVAHQLAARGHQVDVVCHNARQRINRYRLAHQASSHDAQASHSAIHTPDDDHPANITIHKLRGLKLSSGVGFRHFGRRARIWCRRHAVDVVHSITIAFPGDLYHPQAGIYQGIHAQAIASRDPHQQSLKRFLLRFSGKQRTLLALERRLATPPPLGPKKIIAISQMEANELKTFYDVPAATIARLDNPRMDPPPDLSQQQEHRTWFRSHYQLNPTDRVAVFVGHDFRRKGLRYAIEAIAQTKSNWKLLVVGLGKVRDYVALAEKLKLEDRIKFIGPTRETHLVYSAADALLLPTFYDSFGFVAIEALSFGLPVISTQTLGCSPIITTHNVGTIVPTPRDTAPMAHALDTLPTDPNSLTALATRARLASAGLTGDDFMTQLLQLYQQCMAAKPVR